MPRTPLADLVSRAFAGAPLAIEAYDGSTAGPADAAVRLVLRSPKALSYLITAPSSLGFARAYVSGELEIHGDLYHALQLVWSSNIGHLPWAERIAMLRSIDPQALRVVEPPESEYGVRRIRSGLRHSKARDAADPPGAVLRLRRERKSTRLNSSDMSTSYAGFCFKQKK